MDRSIAAAGGARVTYTPSLAVPAKMALRTLPKACFAGRWPALDYQVRPRAYVVDRSLQLLGPYQQVALETGIRAVVRQHREGSPQ